MASIFLVLLFVLREKKNIVLGGSFGKDWEAVVDEKDYTLYEIS